MKLKPAAFMSYVHEDDVRGRLTEFRERLSEEVRLQTGKEFPIFQDRNDIGWGQNWKKRIKNSLDQVTFLIPIITPSFFNSRYCRDELHQFLDREKELDRNDLILPVYYMDSPLLNDEARRADDELAQVIGDRQYADFREFRFEPFASPRVGEVLAQLGTQIRDTLLREERLDEQRPAPDNRRSPGSREALQLTHDDEPGSESGAATRRPVAKTEPPTHVVDAMCRADHATITAAIEAAKPGDRILVRPGLYQEGLVVDKPLEIIGEGDLDEIEVQATGKVTLLFQTTMGRVNNLTLRQTGGGDWYAVDIVQGRLELEECDISSQSLACVAIRSGAAPLVYRNRIHDGRARGIFVGENSQGTLAENDVFGNARSGVSIEKGSDPTLRRNRIHDNVHSGVFVYEKGRGTLEDNDIFDNAQAGVTIREGSDPTLRRNRIHDNRESGLLVRKNGQGTLEDNDIFGNTYSGVEIRSDGDPTLRRNRIRDGKAGGVLVHRNGRGTLEDNDIFGNVLSGVAIREGGNPTLRRNRINRNGDKAVWVRDGGGGTVEDNDLRNNAQGAWSVSADSEPNLKRARNIE